MERTAAACGGICFSPSFSSYNSIAHFRDHHPQLHNHLNSSLLLCSAPSSLSSLNNSRRIHSTFLANSSPSACKFDCHSLNVGNSSLHASTLGCNSPAPARNAGNSSPQDWRLVCHSSSSSASSSAEPEQAEAGEQVRLPEEEADGKSRGEEENEKPRKAFQSSWDAKDSEGNDYLYRLGKEADNLNVSVGARAGMIDHVFIGNFLGKDADIVFDYRQKVTRSLKNLTGDYYIAPAFLDKVVTHIAKNYLVSSLETQVPLILGIWGGKGQGKSFQLELICKALDMEPIILSAGELESEWAGEPGKLIRDRYRTAAQVIKTRGKMSALVINDLDAGIGRFENTQCTVNNQMVVGSLMNLADNPTRVSIGQTWREADVVNRVPIIVTGNDLSTIWAPLIRDGRMDKFYWQPTREDIVNIVYHMYLKDGLSMEDIGTIVDTYPNQALDFYGALRSRSYDKEILKWIQKIGGAEKLAKNLVSKKKKDEVLSLFEAPEATIEKLIEAGNSLAEEQKLVNDMRLSDVYMKKQTGPGISILAS